jgi:hypothetical protein
MRRQEADEHIVLACKAGGFYWISFDGRRVLRGFSYSAAEKLQPGFVAAMEHAGAPARSRRRVTLRLSVVAGSATDQGPAR